MQKGSNGSVEGRTSVGWRKNWIGQNRRNNSCFRGRTDGVNMKDCGIWSLIILVLVCLALVLQTSTMVSPWASLWEQICVIMIVLILLTCDLGLLQMSLLGWYPRTTPLPRCPFGVSIRGRRDGIGDGLGGTGKVLITQGKNGCMA